jgi:GNAT superfamily N-acetyltransferase
MNDDPAPGLATRRRAPDASARRIQPAERAQAIATLVSAFLDDPVERWLYPDDGAYAEWFPEFVQAFGGQAIDAGTAWCLGDLTAVAFWLPPGLDPDGEAVAALLSRGVAPDRHGDMFAALGQMGAAHPTTACWYLPWFGVRRELQGHGLGGRLMAASLADVDASGRPAYLETPSPRTVPFYERHGFSVTGVTRAGGCPPITFMLRAPVAPDPPIA